jgi:hypothetical protein
MLLGAPMTPQVPGTSHESTAPDRVGERIDETILDPEGLVQKDERQRAEGCDQCEHEQGHHDLDGDPVPLLLVAHGFILHLSHSAMTACFAAWANTDGSQRSERS